VKKKPVAPSPVDAELLKQIMADPPGPLFLKYENRESFFDPGVQSVLMTRHPSSCESGTPKHWPITAWQMTDQYVLVRNLRNFSGGEIQNALEVHEAFSRDPLFIAELLAAIVRFRFTKAARIKDPDDTLAQIQKWRTDFLFLSKVVPRGYLEGWKKRRSDSAYRKAVHDENKRRDKIMADWLDCWTAYFRIESAEKCPAKARYQIARNK
jgi:hypothetical protein